MNHFYRVVTFLLCFMVFNSWAETPLLIEEDLFTTCADRTASNTTRCMNDTYLNTRYGGYILLRGIDNHYKLENGRFQEFLDGTANLTGRWVNIERGDVKFDVDIKFSGRTTTTPNDPKTHACLNANTNEFYYYTHTSGTLKGRNAVAGARIAVTRMGEAFQVGIGANVTNNQLNFGASGWLAMTVTAPPTTGFNLELQTSSAGGNGDININLDGNPTACFGSDITLNCPNDITTVAQLGQSGKVVTWAPPVATTTCMVGNGTTCSATDLSGFEYLGEFNGSRYYCSAENTHTWLQARDRAIAAGGTLAVICSQAENDFIQHGLLADYAWIGYSDHISEDNFKWVTGDDCGYTNWSRGEPNNSYGDEDFTRLLKTTGKWTDRSPSFKAEYIMEIPCQGSMNPGNVVTTQIAGPAPGSEFPIGMTEVKYEAIDECGNTEICTFKVTVEEPVDPCAGNGSPSVQVEAIDPDCGQNNGKIKFTFNDNPNRSNIEFSRDGGQTYPLNELDNSGMAMFSDLAAGTYNLSVRWGNDECAVDLGTITLADIRQTAGTQCDDRDATTINDVIAADGCTCGGTPVGEINLVCADDIAEKLQPGETGVVVTFNEPTASTTCGLDGLNIDQIEGLASGSVFPIGTTIIKYRVTDACGNMEMCSLKVVIEATPLMFDLLCADDITVTENVGDNGVVVTFNDPSIISNCPADGFTVTMTAGLASGSVFPVGMTTVTFSVEDGCGQADDCSFKVTVNPAPTGEISIICAENQTITIGENVSTAIVEYDEPVAITTCELDGLNVTLVEGLPSGSAFPIGANTVVYEATDACGEVERCSLIVTVVQFIEPCLNDIVIENKVCSDNGTPTDPSDDTYTFDVIVMRTGGAATSYTGSYSNAFLGAFAYTADYDEVVTLGPFPAGTFTSSNTNPPVTVEGGLDINLSIVDAADANCTDAVVVESTGPCSDELPKVKVGDIVFNDANGNGLQDNGEAGIKEVFVQLIDADGEVIAFATTDDDGMYMFGGLDAGNYQLKFMGQPDNLIPTLQDEGDNDDKDSDIDENGLTEIFTLTTGFDDSRDAGFKPRIVEPDPATIGNQVFVDANENGKKDDGETGIDGVEVKLIAENGDVLQTTNTQNGGLYSFIVVAGNYRVMFGMPFGFNPTNQSGNATDGIDNDSDNDPTTGMTELFAVAAGDVNTTIDAGFVAQTDPCDNITNGGTIEADEDPEACGPYDAAAITNVELPSGGSGDIEYIWLASTESCPTELTDMIPGANGPDYDPGVLRETTYFVRCARRVGCTVWIESGCIVKKVDACDNGGPVDCDAITATVVEGIVKVDGLIGSNAKVEVIGAGTGWIPTLVCGDGGDACENPQMIMNLPEGDYKVKVQLWGADGSYCYTERDVTVTGGEPVCDVDGGTISTNDDTTDLCVGDNEANMVNFSVTGSNGTNRAWVVTDNNGIILNADAPNSIDFEGAGSGTCYVYYLRYENIEGLTAGANIDDLSGCFDKSNRIEVSRTENCGDPTCEVDGGTISTNDDTTDLCVGDKYLTSINSVFYECLFPLYSL